MKLYELTENYKELESLVESGELSAEMIKDTIDGIDAEFEDKVKSCMMIRQQYLNDEAAANAEVARLLELARASKRKAESMSDYVRVNMQSLGKDKIDAGIFKLTLKKASAKLGVIDEAKIPKSFWVSVPATEKIDKRALLSAVKLKPIDGVELIDGERALIVK